MVPFDLVQLRYAVMAADQRSFSQAALKLRVNRRTLSKRILLLEQRLGVTLFERDKRGAVPTRAGIDFFQTARRLMEELEALGMSARATGKGEAGMLAVGFSTSLSAGHLRAVIRDFVTRYPDVTVRAVETGFEALTRGLLNRTLDVAIIAGELDGDRISNQLLWPERLMVGLPETHPLAGKDRIYWTDLRQETFVFTARDPGPDASDQVRARLRDPGHSPNIVMQDINRENILNMVSLGGYVTLVAETAVGAHHPGVVLREIHDLAGLAHVDFRASWHVDNDNPVLRRFFRIIGERHPAFVVP